MDEAVSDNERGQSDHDICYVPNCGQPARFTVNVGDEAGVALRRVCADDYNPE